MSRVAWVAVNAIYVLLADTILILHLAYILFIPLGGFLAWRWRWLVGPHLAAIAVGLISITLTFDCPLTTWEQSLRRRGGQRAYTDGFVDHYLTGRVYPHGYAWTVQLLFGLCIVVSYAVLIWRRRQERRLVRSRS